MKAIRIIAFCLATVIFSSCDHKGNNEPKDVSAPVPQSGVDVSAASLGAKKDLVCGMEMKDGGIADTVNYQSKVYGFCSSECKAEFAKNPSQYLTQK